MTREQVSFDFEVYESSAELNVGDRQLLEAAHRATSNAYAPYSEFNVGAAAELMNGEIITGGNQENASYPAGICAEGVTLAIASARFPGMPIKNMAITYQSAKVNSNHPIAPCGICRQSLQEFKERTGSPIRLILAGEKGKVFILPDASLLLPFAFKF